MLSEQKGAFKNVVLILDMLLVVGDFEIKSWFLSDGFNQRMTSNVAVSFIIPDMRPSNLFLLLFLWAERSHVGACDALENSGGEYMNN